MECDGWVGMMVCYVRCSSGGGAVACVCVCVGAGAGVSKPRVADYGFSHSKPIAIKHR